AFRIAFDFTHDTEEAKDLSQEAFLRAFSRIKQFDGRSSFYTWFYRLVVNICLDHTRRKGRVIWERLEKEKEGAIETVELADGSSLPDEEAIAGEAKRRAEQTLGGVPNKEREAFFLGNAQGFNIPEH